MKSGFSFRWAIILGSVFLSLYALSPTLFNLEGLKAPYSTLFPKRGLNEGLDLRGGIYLELEADIEDSLTKRLTFLEAEITRNTKEEAFAPEKVTVLSSSPEGKVPDRLEVTLKKEGDVEGFKDWFRNYYRDSWSFQGVSGLTLSYGLSDTYRDRLTGQVMSQAIESVRNRIDRYGVSEAAISRYGADQIIIELPGVKDPERVIDIVRKTGQLEFKVVSGALDQAVLTTMIEEARKTAQLETRYDKEAVDALNAALKDKLPAETEIAFELNRDPMTKEILGGTPYLLGKKADLTGDLLEDARVSIQNNEPHVSLSHNPTGTRLLAELTKNNVGRPLAIVLDGNVVKAPTIREPIPNGQAQITLGYGNYENMIKEAEDLALVLREGALPASLTITKRNLIGPSIGADSVQKGVLSCLVGAALVVIFMAAYYKTSGVVADISLILNMILLMGTLSALQASLTLPGIAGIALTVGMAVDANVIIFERIKDELSYGHPLKAAFERGYANAMSSVLDANITTFISGVVLYQFGTGPIKGFATTLMIGILSTLVTAIVFSKWIQEALLEKNGWTRIRI